MRQKYYAKANKEDALLARLLRGVRSRNANTALKTGTGERVTRLEELQETLAEYDDSLYASQNPQADLQVGFLGKVQQRRLEREGREALNQEITEGEVGRVIRKLQANKARGYRSLLQNIWHAADPASDLAL